MSNRKRRRPTLLHGYPGVGHPSRMMGADLSDDGDGSELVEFDMWQAMWGIGTGRIAGDEARVLAAMIAANLEATVDITEIAAEMQAHGRDPMLAAKTLTVDELIESATSLVKAGLIGAHGPMNPR